VAALAKPRQDLLEIFRAALAAVHGEHAVATRLQSLELKPPVYVVAVGKGACTMARGAQLTLGDHIVDAIVVTKRGGAEPLPWSVIEAGHPIPDDMSLEAGKRVQEFIAQVPANAAVLVLLSGGGSALLERLPDGVTLADLRRLNEWLIAGGYDIQTINAIRKRVSLVKGGRLAQQLAPRAVVCLAISDVTGDDPRSIASGPLTPEPSSTIDTAKLPDFARKLLGNAPPMPLPDDPCFARLNYEIVARNEDAKRAAAETAKRLGYRVILEPDPITGDALQAGAALADRVLRDDAGTVHIWGGETTVVLPENPGRGGRNQALALAAAIRLRDERNVYFLAAGTDGTDGPTEDAGALVDGDTVARGASEGLDAGRSLAQADAGTFLEASGDLIQTGPTGTNVMDLVLSIRT
jgi:glycerate 2-kinase